jgi:glycerate 2-kinase
MGKLVSDQTARDVLQRMLTAAISAADPSTCLPSFLPPPPIGKTIVVGAGKAGARMAETVEALWDGPLMGLVIVPYGYGSSCERIEVVQAAHPVPDDAGYEAARRILALAGGATADDLVLCLISGGGSALMSVPAPGLMLHEKAALNSQLLRSGADIAEMNCVRKHLSSIKGGHLAATAMPARMVTLLISDVPGDDPSVIASGPTVADPTTFSDAQAVLNKYGIDQPIAALNVLKKARTETLKPGDDCFRNCETHIIATPQMSLQAAAEVAHGAGIKPLILGDAVEGEAREVAKVMAAIAKQMRHRGQPVEAPAVLLSGGETTVTVTGDGRGGRNSEFLLALAIALNGEAGINALAADTDGIDGIEDNAGAILSPDTLERAARKRIDAKAYLANNDAYEFFQRIDDLVITGPTHTNVNDFRAILIA